eukprot:m.65137 g.65137  ORF g.65137 m.65137 type:complete len:1076 (+) comp35305_c0_seq3:137-3364(+)
MSISRPTQGDGSAEDPFRVTDDWNVCTRIGKEVILIGCSDARDCFSVDEILQELIIQSSRKDLNSLENDAESSKMLEIDFFEISLLPTVNVWLQFNHCIVLVTPRLVSSHAGMRFVDKLCCKVSEVTFDLFDDSLSVAHILPIYSKDVSRSWLQCSLPSLGCRVPLSADVRSALGLIQAKKKRSTQSLALEFTMHADEFTSFEHIWPVDKPTEIIDVRNHDKMAILFSEDAAENGIYVFAACPSPIDHLCGYRIVAVNGKAIGKEVFEEYLMIPTSKSVAFEVQQPLISGSTVFEKIKTIEKDTEIIKEYFLEKILHLTLRERKQLIRKTLFSHIQQYQEQQMTTVSHCLGVPPNLRRLLMLGSLDGFSWQEYQLLHEFSINFPDVFWKELCQDFWYYGNERYVIMKSFTDNVDVAFMPGTTTNLCANLLDRNIEDKKRGNEIALYFYLLTGNVREYTYIQLKQCVCRCAAFLQAKGIKHGRGENDKKDIVLLFLPKCAERIIYLLACFRIAVPVGVVHPETSARKLINQMKRCCCSVIVTSQGEGEEGTNPFKELKEVMGTFNDFWIKPKLKPKVIISHCFESGLHTDSLIGETAPCFCHPSPAMSELDGNSTIVQADAESPLFFAFTRGLTGKCKTVEHATFGYMVYTEVSFRYILDFCLKDKEKPDVCFCTDDLAWIYGMTAGLCGPLLCGGTTVMYQGSLAKQCQEPRHSFNAEILTEIVEKFGVTHLCTVPKGVLEFVDYVSKNCGRLLTQLKVLTSAGAPFTQNLHNEIVVFLRKHHLRFTDVWWQTETGSFVMGCPANIGENPEDKRDLLPFYGINAELKTNVKNGRRIHTKAWENAGGVKDEGEMCFTQPWPGCVRKFLGDEGDEQFMKIFDLEEFGEKDRHAFRSGDWVEMYERNPFQIRVLARVEELIQVGDSQQQCVINAAEVEELLLPVVDVPRYRTLIDRRPKFLWNATAVAVSQSKQSGLCISVEFTQPLLEGYMESLASNDIEELEDYVKGNFFDLGPNAVTTLALFNEVPIEAETGKKNRYCIQQTLAEESNIKREITVRGRDPPDTFTVVILWIHSPL